MNEASGITGRYRVKIADLSEMCRSAGILPRVTGSGNTISAR